MNCAFGKRAFTIAETYILLASILTLNSTMLKQRITPRTNTAMATSNPQIPCDHCGRPVPLPVLICCNCGEGVNKLGHPDTTAYCSNNCRLLNREAHQKGCNDKNVRKQIYRAGELLQEAFHGWRYQVFDLHVVAIQRKQNGIHA